MAGLTNDSSMQLQRAWSNILPSLNADIVYFAAYLIAAGASNRKPATVEVMRATSSTIRPPAPGGRSST